MVFIGGALIDRFGTNKYRVALDQSIGIHAFIQANKMTYCDLSYLQGFVVLLGMRHHRSVDRGSVAVVRSHVDREVLVRYRIRESRRGPICHPRTLQRFERPQSILYQQELT